mmetsp:Transcript_89245/g.178366  ORF Transcript_89245/g.178366 Transcript_89245/m.178366 type:complete len:261 (-) Transcript_89245:560-1342(-)
MVRAARGCKQARGLSLPNFLVQTHTQLILFAPRLGEEALDAQLLVVRFRHPELGSVFHDVSEDRSPEEHHVLSARRVLDLELELLQPSLVPLEDLRQVQVGDVLLQAGGQAGVHGGAPREDDVLVVCRPRVHVRLLDHAENHLPDPARLGLHVDEVGVEQRFRRLEPLPPQLDHPPVGESERLLQHRGFLREFPLRFDVARHVAVLLLDLPHGLEVGRAVERVAPQQQQLDQVVGDVPPRHVEAGNQVLGHEPFVHGHHV